jgi:hypothetical protein
MIPTAFVIFNTLVVLAATCGFLVLRRYYLKEMSNLLKSKNKTSLNDLE